MRSGLKRAAVLVALLAVVGAACGGGSGDGGDKQTATTTADKGADSGGTPERGGSMTYALEAETTGGWCLAEGQLAIAGIQVARTIYDTLTVPDDKGEYVPWLAESVTPNAAYDEWTIKLRDGVTFHDGSALTAEVVKNNIDAYRGKYPARSPLLFLFVFENIDTVSVVDPLTVKVTTKTPWPAFPAYLHSSGRMGIMGQSQLDDTKTCDRKLVGTGPFMLEDGGWKVNDHFTATRNPSWWYAKESGKPYPYLDSITYKPISNGDDRLRAFTAGDIDAAHFDNENQLRELQQGEEAGENTLTSSNKQTELNYTMLNASKPPFDDIRMRRAAAKSLDRDAMNQLLWAGIGTPASGPFSPGNMGYTKDAGYPTFDPEGAKKLVDEYVADGGSPKVTLTSTSDPNTLELVQTEANAWKAAGFDVSLNQVADQSQYINVAIGGDFQAMTWRNHPGGDPDTQYVWWYNKDGDPTVNPVNFGRIPDKEIGKLLEQGRAESDPAAREKIYQQINKRFSDQVWNLWENWSIWSVPTANAVQAEGGVLGPKNPDGSSPFPGLATGHPVYQFWRAQQ